MSKRFLVSEHQGATRASCSLRSKELNTVTQPAEQGPGQQAEPPSEASRAEPEMVVRFNQNSRSIRQAHGDEAGPRPTWEVSAGWDQG